MPVADIYETDFYAWAMENAELLRQSRLLEIDISNLAEELESMGKSVKHTLRNRLVVLIAHLLKWHYQVGKRSRSWRNTIRVQRMDLWDLLQDNPSLKPILADTLNQAYTRARLLAVDDTNLDESHFPETCPFTLEQVLSDDYWPE